mmetsp:Transcript_30797/g.88963  ORF Transcript_30797/g.88963 Transcript_30797/m.88963 type:complete len:257 (-) Transcript_30797:29-799(-)
MRPYAIHLVPVGEVVDPSAVVAALVPTPLEGVAALVVLRANTVPLPLFELPLVDLLALWVVQGHPAVRLAALPIAFDLGTVLVGQRAGPMPGVPLEVPVVDLVSKLVFAGAVPHAIPEVAIVVALLSILLDVLTGPRPVDEELQVLLKAVALAQGVPTRRLVRVAGVHADLLQHGVQLALHGVREVPLVRRDDVLANKRGQPLTPFLFALLHERSILVCDASRSIGRLPWRPRRLRLGLPRLTVDGAGAGAIQRPR